MRTKEPGSAVIPFAENFEGSTVFLPFQADRLYFVQVGTECAKRFERRWENWKWSERQDAPNDIEWHAANRSLCLPMIGLPRKLEVAVYAKDFRDGRTWGRLSASHDPAVVPGEGDRYFPHYCQVDLSAKDRPVVKVRGRHGQDKSRPRIYQLFVRLFGNTNETRRPNGTLADERRGQIQRYQ